MDNQVPPRKGRNYSLFCHIGFLLLKYDTIDSMWEAFVHKSMYGVLEMFRKGGERKKKRVLLWFSIRKTLNKKILVSRLFTLCYFDSYTLVSLSLGAEYQKEVHYFGFISRRKRQIHGCKWGRMNVLESLHPCISTGGYLQNIFLD